MLKRKLTAMLCADVFGYSRLMGNDEEATLRLPTSDRRTIDSCIEPSSVYEGEAVRARRVSGELGGKFILEGSVQKSAEEVRIATRSNRCDHWH